MKMNELNVYRKNMSDDVKPYFNQMRKTFADICNEHCKKKLISSLKSSNEFRVKFQKDPIRYDTYDDDRREVPNRRPNAIANKLLESYSQDDKSSR
jgi:hypothetical protein